MSIAQVGEGAVADVDHFGFVRFEHRKILVFAVQIIFHFVVITGKDATLATDETRKTNVQDLKIKLGGLPCRRPKLFRDGGTRFSQNEATMTKVPS